MKFFFMALLLPMACICQTANVITYSRFFPKTDKVAAFEKALKNHGAKFHNGDWKWRVLTIQSGPDAGGYETVEGPATWEQLDKRGNINPDHTNDLYNNLMPLLSDKTSEGYAMFRDDLSTTQLTDYAAKISVSHVFPKPGKGLAVEDIIKAFKKVWEAAGQSIAVYEASSSGPVQYIIVTRYKQGLKERDPNFRKPIKERYEAVNGQGSFDKYLAAIAENVDHQWAEMLSLDADLSPK